MARTSELAGAITMLGKLGLNVIHYPSGKWGFVGRVPMELAYVKADATVPSDAEQREIAQSSNPGMSCKVMGIKTRVFDTQADALSTAHAAGYSVDNA